MWEPAAGGEGPASRTYFCSIDLPPSECTSHTLEMLPGHRTRREQVYLALRGGEPHRTEGSVGGPPRPCLAPTVLARPLLCAQGADLHFL